MKQLIILGSTGSIGTQTLDIVRSFPEDFAVIALSCRSRIQVLREQIIEFLPRAVAVGTEEMALELSREFPELEIYVGDIGVSELALLPADMLVNALMGISGLLPTFNAIASGKDVALANKETLVAGGEVIINAVKEYDVKLLPIDSEHSAIFQCINSSEDEIKRILLTCSGGPFREYSSAELSGITAEQALKHPKWSMGSKITIDSATLMNKGLEVIEARWLFDVKPCNIEVHVHPECLIHSMVEFCDGSIIAQLANPDMRLPISYALNYPRRLTLPYKSLDLFEQGSLTFERPRRDVFRCLDLAYQAINQGDSYPIVLNASNEVLVQKFLDGEIEFLQIPEYIEKSLNSHHPSHPSTVSQVLQIDNETRERLKKDL